MKTLLGIGVVLATGTAGLLAQDSNAELLRATQAETKKDFRSALGIYRKVSSDGALGEAATLGELRCLSALKDFPALQSRADSLLKDAQAKKNTSRRLLVAAYTGEGDVDDASGRTKEALFNYLRGLAAPAENESFPEHEAALARCSLSCSKIARAATDRSTKETYRNRAREILAELEAKYPGTPLKSEVEKALSEIR